MTPPEFWDWFRANELRLWEMADREDELLDEIQEVLGSYRNGLCLELSDEENGTRELVISAAGDEDLFGAVDVLVAHAPRLNRWKFTALKPPRGFDFVLETRTARLDPKTMVFEPLTNDVDPLALGIRVFLSEGRVGPDTQETVTRAVETGLGERVRSEIQHIEVAPLQGSPSEHIPLADLPAYMEWFKRKASSA